jgi:Domain of unknown function (DUF4326)/Protein of unknown function (DUF3102)
MGEVERSLDALAEEINEEHRQFVGTFGKTLEHGIRAGGLLAAAKEQCPHGSWLPWLKANFEGSPRTAQDYMRLHSHRDEVRAKTQDSAYLSMSGALREIATPREIAEGKGMGPGPKFMQQFKQAARALDPSKRQRDMEQIVEQIRGSQGGREANSPGGREATVGQFSSEERALFDTFREGKGIVVNMHENGPHKNLLAWLKDTDQLLKADRSSKWGNPFEMPDDGDRETVVRLHKEHYLPHKRKLLDQLPRMGGTAWGCWCGPQPCHCDELLRIAEGEGSSRAQ